MEEEESPVREERMAKVEGILEEVRTRLNHLETGIDGLRNLMGEEISGLRQQMHTNFRWRLGIMISMWVTIILAIIFTS